MSPRPSIAAHLRSTAVVGAAVLALGFTAGCGGGDEVATGGDTSPEPTVAAADATEQDVVEALDLSPDGPGSYLMPDGRCGIYRILIGESAVQGYAGDNNLATNEEGNLGALFTLQVGDVSDAECADTIGGALDDSF